MVAKSVQHTGVFRGHSGDWLGRVGSSEMVGNRVRGLGCAGRENQPCGIETQFRGDDSAGFFE
jgi:hypothetical protein